MDAEGSDFKIAIEIDSQDPAVIGEAIGRIISALEPDPKRRREILDQLMVKAKEKFPNLPTD